MVLRTIALLVLVACGMACGGGNKPPLQPDNDNPPGVLGDGGPDPTPGAAPAPSR